jgi:hypothetical protein
MQAHPCLGWLVPKSNNQSNRINNPFLWDPMFALQRQQCQYHCRSTWREPCPTHTLEERDQSLDPSRGVSTKERGHGVLLYGVAVTPVENGRVFGFIPFSLFFLVVCYRRKQTNRPGVANLEFPHTVFLSLLPTTGAYCFHLMQDSNGNDGEVNTRYTSSGITRRIAPT